MKNISTEFFLISNISIQMKNEFERWMRQFFCLTDFDHQLFLQPQKQMWSHF